MAGDGRDVKSSRRNFLFNFLDPFTCALYAYLEIEDEERWLKTSKTVVNQKWWDFMSDIMDTNYDNSPSSVELLKIFELEH